MFLSYFKNNNDLYMILKNRFANSGSLFLAGYQIFSSLSFLYQYAIHYYMREVQNDKVL